MSEGGAETFLVESPSSSAPRSARTRPGSRSARSSLSLSSSRMPEELRRQEDELRLAVAVASQWHQREEAISRGTSARSVRVPIVPPPDASLRGGAAAWHPPAGSGSGVGIGGARPRPPSSSAAGRGRRSQEGPQSLASQAGAAEVDDDGSVFSVAALDSDEATPRGSRAAEAEAQEDAEAASSTWGLGDTIRSANSTARSESDSLQQTARSNVPGGEDTAPLNETVGNTADSLTGILQQLAMENISLDDSLARSVQRVLQLGTALAGQRLSDDEIRALPKVRFEATERQSCSICLEAYTRGELLTSLRCGHFFHVDCLGRWFQHSTQCPLCRSQCAD